MRGSGRIKIILTHGFATQRDGWLKRKTAGRYVMELNLFIMMPLAEKT